jgi:hypothetical protein
MILIALAGLCAVVITHCQRDAPYMDPEEIRPGTPDRVPPPPPDRR